MSARIIYLLHFVRVDAAGRAQSAAYRHARHYCGSTDCLSRRLAEHRNGRGSNLCRVIHDAGLSFVVTRTWHGSRVEERRLKRGGGFTRRCPICQGRISIERAARRWSRWDATSPLTARRAV